MHRELDIAGHAIIDWHLAARGFDAEAREGLFAALRSGLACEEADSIAFVDRTVASAREAWERDPDPALPVRLFGIHAEMRMRADAARDLDRLAKANAVLRGEAPTAMARRVRSMKAAAALKGI